MDDLSELKSRYDRLNLLYQVGNVIHSTLDAQEALQLIMKEAVRLMRASSGSTVLINPTSGFLEIHASHGLPPRAADLKLRVGEGITGWVARTGKPARVGDITSRSTVNYAVFSMSIPSARRPLAPTIRNCLKPSPHKPPASYIILGSMNNFASKPACSNRWPVSAKLLIPP